MNTLFPELPILSASAAPFAASRIHRIGRCGSTNDEARDLLLDGAPEGTAVLAESQDAGRGRLGRSWHSPPGLNLYLSLVLRPNLQPEAIPLLTLVLALASYHSVRATGTPVAIKWPNDLVVRAPGARRARKLSGIVCEAVSLPGGSLGVVAGVGVNVNLPHGEFPVELQPIATSIRAETGVRQDRAALAAALLEAFAPRYRRLLKRGPDGILPEYLAFLETVGRDVTVDVGDRRIRGAATGLGPLGELTVLTSSGRTETITAGDVGL